MYHERETPLLSSKKPPPRCHPTRAGAADRGEGTTMYITATQLTPPQHLDTTDRIHMAILAAAVRAAPYAEQMAARRMLSASPGMCGWRRGDDVGMSAFTMEVAHLATYGCTPAPGDTTVKRWSEVTCAACMSQMPSAADNGALTSMVDNGIPRVAGFEPRPWLRNCQCLCGFREERWATAEQMLAEAVLKLTSVVRILGIAAKHPGRAAETHSGVHF